MVFAPRYNQNKRYEVWLKAFWRLWNSPRMSFMTSHLLCYLEAFAGVLKADVPAAAEESAIYPGCLPV